MAQGLLAATQMSPELQHLVSARGDEIVRKWAHRCTTNNPSFRMISGFPAKKKELDIRLNNGTIYKLPECNVDDFVLFSGLLCFAGEGIGCTFVKNSIDSVGQVWRSPAHRGLDDRNEFSRDMRLGVQLYLIATKDASFAANFAKFLESRRGLGCVKNVVDVAVGQDDRIKYCTIKHGKQILEYVLGSACANATDTKCSVFPAIWDSMFYVYKSLGLVPSPSMVVWNSLLDISVPDGDFNEVKNSVNEISFKESFKEGVFKMGDALASLFTEGTRFITIRKFYLRNATMSSPKGYELHLKAVQGMVYQAMDQREVANEILKRVYDKEPDNLFFEALRHGTNDAWAQKFDAMCPAELVLAINEQGKQFEHISKQVWSLEVAAGSPQDGFSQPKGKAIKVHPNLAMTGWECQFLAKLAFKRLPTTQFPSQTECKVPVYDSGRQFIDTVVCSQYTKKIVNALAKNTPQKAALASCYGAVTLAKGAAAFCEGGEFIVEYAPQFPCTISQGFSWTSSALVRSVFWVTEKSQQVVNTVCTGWNQVKQKVCSTLTNWFGDAVGSFCEDVIRYEPFQYACKALQWTFKQVQKYRDEIINTVHYETRKVNTMCKQGVDKLVRKQNWDVCQAIDAEFAKCQEMESRFKRFLEEKVNPNMLCQASRWEYDLEKQACEALR